MLAVGDRQKERVNTQWCCQPWTMMHQCVSESCWFYLMLELFTTGEVSWMQFDRLETSKGTRPWEALDFIPWPPRRRIIKWLASLYSPGTLAEPHYYLHYAQWIGLSFALVGFLLHMRRQHPFACNLHEIVQPSIQLQLHGSRSLEKQGNWYWKLSVASDNAFPVSPLPLRVKPGRCLGKLNPFEMSAVVLVSPLFFSGWKTGPDREKERAEGMVEKKRKKVGCPFVFVRGVSRSQWEAIKYLVWAPRSMFH